MAEAVAPLPPIIEVLGSIPCIGLFTYELGERVHCSLSISMDTHVFVGFFRIKCCCGCPSVVGESVKDLWLSNKQVFPQLMYVRRFNSFYTIVAEAVAPLSPIIEVLGSTPCIGLFIYKLGERVPCSLSISIETHVFV